MASYTANLAAFLTVESMDFKIRNVDDLVAQTKVKYGTVEGGSSQDFFMVGYNYRLYRTITFVLVNVVQYIIETVQC